MNPHDPQQSGTTLRDALSVIRRRRGLVILCAFLVPAAALAFSMFQTPAYQGQADVLLSQKNIGNSLTNTQDQSIQANDADRVAQTQAELAATPIVARNTLNALKITDITPAQLLNQTEISSSQNSDILVFKITDEDQLRAKQLVNEYAEQYTIFRTKIDTASIARALSEVSKQLQSGSTTDPDAATLRDTLIDKREQLRTLQALQTSNSFIVRTENLAEQVKPTPVRNTVLGLLLGIMLGVALAFAFDALDTRLRTAEDIAEAIGSPLLVRVPLEKKRRDATLPLMLSDPNSPDTEAYRLLRSNLEFASLGADSGVLLFTSAVENEGKSTTVANLAVACARSGKNVCLVDLDLRRPSLERTFDLLPRPGITNIAVGSATLQQALIRLRLGDTTGASTGSNPE
ncbi:MAG: YveK family protein, partial [Solirubrobacterales bacterium]